MPITLLTGANGFVAAHLLDQLIAAGHTVVGSVRSPSKGEQILATHPEYADQLSFVVVADYAAEGTWDEAFQEHDFDYVVHSAAPLLDDPRNTDFDEHYLRPSVSGLVPLSVSASRVRVMVGRLHL
jgi:nucleoside-diphosphate-sugar epimerase